MSAIKFDESKLKLSEEFGYLAGLIFQFTDDVLDVLSTTDKMGKSIGKDDVAGKFTSVKLYGLNETKAKVQILSKKAKEIAKTLDNSGFLQSFIDEITDRINEN